MRSLVYACCLWMISLQVIADDGYYETIDKQGRRIYTDKPVDETSRKLEMKQGSENTATTEQERKQKRDKLLRAYEEERRINNEQDAKDKKKREELEYRCARERDSLTRMKRGGSFYDLDKDGNRVFLGDAEVKDRIAEMESTIEKYCK